MNDFKVLIKNLNTGEEKWYTCPLDEDAIYRELKLNSTQYKIAEYEAPCDLSLCDSIGDVINEYDAYIRLPEILKDNIGIIMNNFDTIQDVFDCYNEQYMQFYSDYKSKYDYARFIIEQSGDVSEFMLDYIDYDKYISDFEISNTIIELPNDKGIIIING